MSHELIISALLAIAALAAAAAAVRAEKKTAPAKKPKR